MMNCSVKRPLSSLLRSFQVGFPRYVNTSATTVSAVRKTVTFSEVPVPPPPTSSGSIPSAEDIQQYVIPLYERGWKSHTRKIPEPNEDNVTIYKGRTIERRFNFNDTPTAFEFFEELVSISSEEKHLPNRLALTSNNVTFSTTSLKAENGDKGTLVGFTCRDLRIAILAETEYNEKYVLADRAPSTISIPQKFTASGYPMTVKVLTTPVVPVKPLTIKRLTVAPSFSTDPLPPSPEVSSPPTPLVNDDFDTYLLPLNSRGWTFNVIQHPRKRFTSKFPEKEYSATYLRKVFAFGTPEASIEFARAAGVLAVEETEDAIIDVNTDLVYVQTTTRLELEGKSRYTVTHRDISLAIRFEELAAEKGSVNRMSTTLSTTSVFPKTVAELETFEEEALNLGREMAVKHQAFVEQTKTRQREKAQKAYAAKALRKAEKAQVAKKPEDSVKT